MATEDQPPREHEPFLALKDVTPYTYIYIYRKNSYALAVCPQTLILLPLPNENSTPAGPIPGITENQWNTIVGSTSTPCPTYQGFSSKKLRWIPDKICRE